MKNILLIMLAVGLTVCLAGSAPSAMADGTTAVCVGNIPLDGVTGGTDDDFCSTDPEEQDQWHFVLNGLRPRDAAPADITAVFLKAGTVQIGLTRLLGPSTVGTAHYTLKGRLLDDTLLSACAQLPDGANYLRFVLSHAPCGAALLCATISPTTRQYDLANPANATTTITWNDATGIVSIYDGTIDLTAGTHYTLVGSTLTILHNPYLQGKLTAAGQSVTLTIDFGICTRTFVVSAIDTSVSVCANISPIANVYDLDNPGDVTTLITWNDSPKSITSIFDGTSNLTSGTHYTVSGHDGTAVLTIKSAYLTGKLTTAGQSVVLTIRFPDDCVATFTITAYHAAVECITISPTIGQYDLASPGDVTTTITDWGTVSTITSIDDGTGFLTPGTHYTVVGNTLTIRADYLASKLTAPGQSVVLTINCDPVCAVPFTIMTVDM